MRLTNNDKSAIISVTQSFVKERASLYLHGSRTDNRLRGGDIDLLIITTAEQADKLRAKKHILLDSIKAKIGEQKIDFIIANEQEKTQDPFIQTVLEKAILLEKFG